MKMISSHFNVLIATAARFISGRLFLLVPAVLAAAAPGASNAQQDGIAYEIVFKGLEDRGVESELKAVSDMEKLRDRPPAGIGLLRSRAERDRKTFIDYFNSRGWYAAEIDIGVDRKADPAVVTFDVAAGPPYLLDDVSFRAVQETTDLEMPSAESLGLVSGKRFEAETFLSAREKLIAEIKSQGRPFPSVVDQRITVDHRNHTVFVAVSVDPGPAAVLADPHIEGLESVEESFVRKMIPWQPGDRYDPASLRALHARLASTRLFAAVRITEAGQVDEEGVLPVTVSLTERKHRSVGVGLTYASDEGPGGKLSWEHRNILRRGERLAAGSTVSDFTRDASVGFEKPFFLRDDQTLRLSTRLADDRPDAYESRSFAAGFRIDRDLGRGVTVGGGAGYKESRITQFPDLERNRFRIVSLPLVLSRDSTDSLLDPRKGGRLTVETIPMLGFAGRAGEFVKLYGRYRRYLQLFDGPSIVAAGSIAAGVIAGAPQGDVPADERFYSGGGGSIRGYSYQSVGPLAGDIPLGGKSLLECAFEIRAAVTENIGVVAFLDGGTAYEAGNFGSGETFRWGTGLGLRYHTPVGPLRLDVGFPLNRRPGIDDSFQFYLSLGQAF